MEAWEGNIAFDATLVKVWGKKGSPVLPKEEKEAEPKTGVSDNDTGAAAEREAKKKRDPDLDMMSPEFQAGWYHRDEEDHADRSVERGKRSKDSAWGYEAHLATMVANNPGETPGFPLLTLAISVDKPLGG